MGRLRLERVAGSRGICKRQFFWLRYPITPGWLFFLWGNYALHWTFQPKDHP